MARCGLVSATTSTEGVGEVSAVAAAAVGAGALSVPPRGYAGFVEVVEASRPSVDGLAVDGAETIFHTLIS